ncbi:MAG: sulfur carrier protein ThiS [Gammaproteobacteria bacterium]
MRIQLNGELRDFSATLSIAELLTLLGVQGRLAVEVNGEIVPRGMFSAYHLQPDDKVEIVKAIGGG